MNTNSNSYTVIYASVMVIIVAFVLAFTSSVLKPVQDKNIKLDKMKQILSALNLNTKGQDAEEVYRNYIKKDMILDANGAVKAEEGGFTLGESKDEFVVYVAEVEGRTKYIIPLYGSGLWGAIWGYIALDEDKDTVYGTYFSHAGETPGLGAEISTPAFQAPFRGKHIMKEGRPVSIAVVKPGKAVSDREYVDGISGGTITSVAVQEMLKNSLAGYTDFLTNNE
ncbi:MAG: NADH:ubiquinone reductase (Na(+)-transporting) subunit C [Mediterranea sp.]|jgi:Na+-transporting NADH:ubiquinone oxidoreductase subunit C|nr:NADH:ubiquinone reductase (Na(+)-transporting) subunit C [Mediterranea sp.]